MCKYCEGKEFVFDSSIWKIQILRGSKKIDIECDSRGIVKDVDFKINYCPMCGRKL
ncbi:hypothetical protein [Clostridium botulinum]|uniref:hypothetical protein n=1 Tax=Clostridium botulinum TaxID=1491 RepID=UPI001E4BE906|nr:hypothetical protein [Clostridium botulinum]MCC5416467.1 hypothetical protein [Clostridium botulinum]